LEKYKKSDVKSNSIDNTRIHSVVPTNKATNALAPVIKILKNSFLAISFIAQSYTFIIANPYKLSIRLIPAVNRNGNTSILHIGKCELFAKTAEILSMGTSIAVSKPRPNKNRLSKSASFY
jgi:hypothetical protein